MRLKCDGADPSLRVGVQIARPWRERHACDTCRVKEYGTSPEGNQHKERPWRVHKRWGREAFGFFDSTGVLVWIWLDTLPASMLRRAYPNRSVVQRPQ
jgi:hypothetical protein